MRCQGHGYIQENSLITFMQQQTVDVSRVELQQATRGGKGRNKGELGGAASHP